MPPLFFTVIPVILGPDGLCLDTKAMKNPFWGISQASEEELVSIAVLIRLLPGYSNFLWKEVKEFLDNFFNYESHEERGASEYERRVAKILALTGWEIWNIPRPCCCQQADFEAKQALLLEWAKLDPLLDDDPDPSTASLVERDNVD